MQSIAVVTGFLLGSIPFSQILALRVGQLDLRISGYGNVGAYNVAHHLGTFWGILAGTLDAAKAWLALWTAHRLGVADPALVAWAVILGHSYPPWLKFRGGKGLAPLIGILLWFAPLATLSGVSLAWVILWWQPRRLNEAAAIGMLVVIVLIRGDAVYLQVVRVLLGFGLLLSIAYAPRFWRWLRSRACRSGCPAGPT